jgi:hypothetical protein
MRRLMSALTCECVVARVDFGPDGYRQRCIRCLASSSAGGHFRVAA